MNKKKMAFVHSLIALLLCVSMLMGTTFAWFTDSVSSGKNQIVAGNLDVVLEYMDAKGNWTPVTEATNVFEENTLWEPGHTEVVYLRVSNAGTLALKYQLGVNIAAESGSINMAGEPFVLSDYIQFATIEGVTAPYADRAAARAAATNPVALSTGYTKEGSLEAGAAPVYVAFVVYMPEDVGNEANYRTGEQPPRIDLGISLLATQFTSESDSFGNTYDFEAGFPKVSLPDTGKADVQVEEGKTAADVTVAGKLVKAEVPAGVSVEEGTTALSLTVTEMSATGSNITASANEELKPVDVHMEGVAADNQTPIAVYMPGFAPVGLNNGNLKLYHVENGETVAMTHVAVATPAHNEFTYDPATGDVVLYLATFSEIAMLADTVNPWNNQYDTSWYNTTDTSFVIANADQFAGFGSIVGGMAKDENNNAIAQDSFSGKTLKLISNINIGDTDSENGYVLYPVGYYNSEGTYVKSGTAITSGFKTFKGTFDGNGHTIANIYQNTWEMKGDNEEYDLTLQYYRDGMGLFGKVYGGTVKNLTVKNFESDGEYTTTGCVAAYADCGATFENIAIFNCNPRVYNIGNGGIVGCVGWYANDAHTTSVTFRNITVDNTNKISALWGSWDVACGGIVGQYYPTSGQTNAIDNGGVRFENCHVAAQIDVYNDVCANYQYYAYRYAGILMGSVRENVTVDGHVYPNMDGITASGCTVHFGDWNDYYYCELVANTTASYTHDHQMSRLTQVAAVNGTSITYLDGATGTVPTSGRYNYVVVNGKTADGKWDHGDGKATCYHFVDGTVWNHADAGTEEVDTDGNGTKETVLKEDKQVIYREFNNLVTGYGWGVTSKAVGEMDGVTILDREEGNSVTKFEAVIEGGTTYRANNERAIGKLFKEATIADPNLAIKSENVQVTVSPKVGTDSTAGGIYTANTTDWTKGTLMFTGKGTAVITITDYYFCTATTVEVEVVENRVTGLSVKTNKNLYDISKNETFSAEDITVSAVFSDGNGQAAGASFAFGLKLIEVLRGEETAQRVREEIYL